MRGKFIPARLLALAVAIIAPWLATVAIAAETGGAPHIQIINLSSDPPGRILTAPGGGRGLTPAVLYTPPQGANVYGPAIVMLDSGLGSNPGRSDEPTRFAAERLAAKGYTVLALYSHLEREYPLYAFSQTRWDIGGALDFLERMGFEDLVLAGRSYGATAVANYLATADDAALATPNRRRVRAAVLFDPVTDVRRIVGSGLDTPRYDAMVAGARATVAAKRGLFPIDIPPGYHPPEDEAPWLVAGRYVMPAQAFLDYFGPEAESRDLDVLTKLPVPTLAIVTDADAASSAEALRRLPVNATGGGLKIVEQREPGYDDPAAQTALTDAMAGFFDGHGLRVRQGVIESFASIRAADGQIFTGVLYRPADGGDLRRPAFIMHHGLSEDAIHSSTHWLGWRLAQAGYAALGVANHSSGVVGATMTGNLAEVADDTARWTDWMAAQGYRRLILQGHSNGGIQISNYMSLKHDPRVVGMVYMAPTLDSPRYARETLGPAYDAEVREAEAAVASGEGDTHIMTHDKLRLARHFLDYAGPNSRATHTDRIKEFDTPILVIGGAKDPLMMRDPAFLDTFAHDHPGPSRVIRLENGSHGMKESKDAVAADIADWTRTVIEGRGS